MATNGSSAKPISNMRMQALGPQEGPFWPKKVQGKIEIKWNGK
jgi:hypothetical protein